MINDNTYLLYIKFSRFCIVVIYLLILAGGVVRATGSGMGCPDWPKCFGMWVPPTEKSQLPENYQEIYANHGYGDMEFNVYKTWTEYINRLLGALTGLFILINTFIAFKLKGTKYSTTKKLAFTTLILVIIQGLIGKYVVSSNLSSGLISIHLYVAFFILATLISSILYLPNNIQKIKSEQITNPSLIRKISIASIIAILLLMIQVFIGTQLRTNIHVLMNEMGFTFSTLFDKLGEELHIHRYIALVLIGIPLFIFILSKKAKMPTFINKYSYYAFFIALIQSIFGAMLNYLDLPGYATALHILFATILFGIFYNLTVNLLILQNNKMNA